MKADSESISSFIFQPSLHLLNIETCPLNICQPYRRQPKFTLRSHLGGEGSLRFSSAEYAKHRCQTYLPVLAGKHQGNQGKLTRKKRFFRAVNGSDRIVFSERSTCSLCTAGRPGLLIPSLCRASYSLTQIHGPFPPEANQLSPLTFQLSPSNLFHRFTDPNG